MAGSRLRSHGAGSSGSIAASDWSASPPRCYSYRNLAARPDKLGASLNAREIGDDPDNGLLIRGRVADAGTPARHRVADDPIAVAAVKAIDDRRQDGFVERKARPHAANIPHIGHVLSEAARTIGRRQWMLEGEFARLRLQLRAPIREGGGGVEPGRLRNPFQVHDRPKLVSPQRHQFETARHDR